MKKIFLVVMIAMLTAVLCFAQSMPSSKNAAQLSEVNLLNWVSGSVAWQNVLTAQLKVAQQKDLMIGVSLETGLFTRTKVVSGNKLDSTTVTTDTSQARSGIKVRVLVDGNEAVPGAVNFDKRVQTLSATLGQVLTGCVDVDGDGHITLDECTATPEDIELILDTMAAHHFNFALPNLASGVHTVTVQVAAEIGGQLAGSMLGQYEAKAMVGKGSLVVNEVRLVKDANIILEP